MAKSIRYVGLDVHAETIAVAIAERRGEVRSMGTILNRAESVRKLVKRLEPISTVRVCYEAGPTGYALYWQLAKLGVKCEVVAPTLVPTKAGDRVKTDRRDAEKLARSYRAGDLTAVWVPDAAHEALRDVVRAREAAIKDERRAKHRLAKFLLRHGLRPPEGVKAWTTRFREWLDSVRFDYGAQNATLLDYRTEVERASDRIARLDKAIDEAVQGAPAQMKAVIDALQALRGVAKVTATTLVCEIGNFSRFTRAKQLMGYGGLVPSEYSSGASTRRGSITKTGNAHMRRVLVEAAWNYRHRPKLCGKQKRRQDLVSERVKDISWKAQQRLHARFWQLTAKGKVPGKAVTAVARELVGFIWAVGVQAEREAANA